MEISNQIVDQLLKPSNWRSHPGYLSEGNFDFESVHVLLGQFLSDRHSPDPLPDAELLSDLRVVGVAEPPSYARLKNDDGARLFARLR